MSTKIQTLLENENVKTFLKDNQEMVQEAEASLGEFPKVLKAFILEHPTEFIDSTLEETKKNIRVFTEIATAQFITEVTTMYAQKAEATEQEVVNKIEEYL